MTIPSIKTLKHITSYPRELRALLEAKSVDELIRLIDSERPFGARSAFGRFKTHHGYQFVPGHTFFDLKMRMADELCETCGVEYIPRGRNAKSPPIWYCNSGDGYTATLMFVRGHYRVGCWADIVGRGNYA
jgi:hypothetical protein